MISGKNAITNITTVLGSCRMLIIKAFLMVPMIVLSNLASTGNTYNVVQITSTAAAMIRTNKETSELEVTELKAEEDQLTVETNESRQLTKAAFQSAATAAYTFVWSSTPAADDNENNENKEENGEVNNEEVNADTNTENTEENGEEN